MRKLLEDKAEQIIELVQMTKELHIVPLKDTPLGPLLLILQQARLGVEVLDRAEGEVMLRIWAQECALTS